MGHSVMRQTATDMEKLALKLVWLDDREFDYELQASSEDFSGRIEFSGPRDLAGRISRSIRRFLTNGQGQLQLSFGNENEKRGEAELCFSFVKHFDNPKLETKLRRYAENELEESAEILTYIEDGELDRFLLQLEEFPPQPGSRAVLGSAA